MFRFKSFLYHYKGMKNIKLRQMLACLTGSQWADVRNKQQCHSPSLYILTALQSTLIGTMLQYFMSNVQNYLKHQNYNIFLR